jgi:hypothetical protein
MEFLTLQDDIPMGAWEPCADGSPGGDDPRNGGASGTTGIYVRTTGIFNKVVINAYVLRGMGYPQMADEHEVNGPRFFCAD